LRLEVVVRGAGTAANRMRLRSFDFALGTVLLSSILAAPCAAAQSPPAASGAAASAPQITGDWRDSAPVALAQSKPPASAATTLAAPPNLALSRMLLLLVPDPAQQQALTAELSSQQDLSSPQYHRWLTPRQFAQTYGNNSSDVAAVAAWLESEGFTLAPLPAGRGWIEFSGTVAQVEQAFATRVGLISSPQGARAVLIAGISIPAALAPVIAGLVSLDGVVSAPALVPPQPLTVSAADLAVVTSPSSAAALTPRVAAQLLDLAPLTFEGVDGAGQTIAIAARSNVNIADVAAFRAAFGLPASPLMVLPDGADPGLTDSQAEATLAASWAGATAPGAQVLLVPAATTEATDGVDLSLAAIVDQDFSNVDRASVIAIGYSSCEAALSSAHQAFYAALYRQAAAEGISVIAAAGDSGAAACTPAGGSAPVSTGYGVNALASTPWNTAAGVAGYGSGSLSNGDSALAAWSPANPADPAYAGGGGSSIVYARPAWQPLAQHVDPELAAGQNRQLPDLALPTAIDSASSPGLAFCLSSPTISSSASTGCTLVRSGGSGMAAAIFAGVAALVDQKAGAQGNLAPRLYAASGAAASSGVFLDVDQGTSQLACQPGSSSCSASDEIGFVAGPGYDLATGLGVPGVEKLVNALASPAVTPITPTVSLTVSPVEAGNAYNPSAIVTFTATVVDPTAAGIPTGTVAIYDSANSDALTPTTTLISNGSAATGSSATFNVELSSLFSYAHLPATGAYSLGVSFTDPTGTYANCQCGNLLIVTSAPSPTILTLASSNNSPVLGSTITITVTAGVSAAGPPAGSVPPTGPVTLYVNGAAAATANFSTAGGVTSATFSVTVNSTIESFQATYPGDANYISATSNLVTLPVEGFMLAPAPSNPPANLDIVLGGAGSEAFVVTGVGGYSAQVQVVCAVASQDDMTCTPNPQQVTPTGTVTFVVQSFVNGGPEYASRKRQTTHLLWPRAAGGAALACLAFFLLPPRSRSRQSLRLGQRRALLLLLLLIGVAASGIGCSSGTLSTLGTPLGVATLKVTATAYVDNTAVSQSVYFTVNVQPQ
jgi:Pro-kumamolisin, activation domain